ncbi:MAG: trypsin-like peptidase domain-containing protein [Oligoflexia bacterium]|nr:trypsin-like peptidase domain-containing protein [Oligoflexia bacterium]
MQDIHEVPPGNFYTRKTKGGLTYSIKPEKMLGSVPALCYVDLTNNNFEDIRILGSAFFVSQNGLFITAKHVVEKDFDSILLGKLQLAVLSHYPKTVSWLPIVNMVIHKYADIAVGQVKIPEEVKIFYFRIGTFDLAAGDEVITYGFSKTLIKDVPEKNLKELHLNPQVYDGKIVQAHLKKATRASLTPTPYYAHDIKLDGGISGGPLVKVKDGAVYATNSTGLETNESGEAHSTSTDIRIALELSLQWLPGQPIISDYLKKYNVDVFKTIRE